MLGGGNPVGGANPTGIGKTLNYLGIHAYAYSGTVEITGTTTPVTMLKFTTGPQYIRAVVQFTSIESGGNDLNFRVLMDSQVVATQSINAAKDFFHDALELIIPPFTQVECDGLNIDTSEGRDSTATIVGRVY
tara:strand:+ start:22 stop:420 length:399 start_codon:yes stop_codon:yes gene_type:complete